jgi:hypothetical protein
MSMTKRYLESLPEEEQNAILGAFPDEWTESAESAPLEECSICGCGFSASFKGIVCPDCVSTEGDREWAEALTDETQDEQC